jgi:hypothetical protein
VAGSGWQWLAVAGSGWQRLAVAGSGFQWLSVTNALDHYSEVLITTFKFISVGSYQLFCILQRKALS